MNQTVTDDLYANFAGKHGWLSRLIETFYLSKDEIAYLEWRDEQDQWAKDKIKEWEYEIESYGGRDIYFADSEAVQFVMLTERINALDGLIDPDLINRMVATRYRLKYGMMRQIEPEAFVGITEDQIEKARQYPLFKLMGLPRKKNIICPNHKEKSPSFNVGIWGFCFTCRFYMDSIGYMMANRSLTFSEAVTDLSNR